MKLNFLETVAICLLFFLPVVLADMGPKPQMDIAVYENNSSVNDEVFYAKLFYCLGSDSGSGEYGFTLGCYDKIPKEICKKLVRPGTYPEAYDRADGCLWTSSPLYWGGVCERGGCHFGYRVPDKFSLVIFLPNENKTFVSNTVENKNFNSNFRADVKSDGTIELQETTSYWRSDASKNFRDFMLAFVITISLELITALIFISGSKNSKHFLSFCLYCKSHFTTSSMVRLSIILSSIRSTGSYNCV